MEMYNKDAWAYLNAGVKIRKSWWDKNAYVYYDDHLKKLISYNAGVEGKNLWAKDFLPALGQGIWERYFPENRWERPDGCAKFGPTATCPVCKKEIILSKADEFIYCPYCGTCNIGEDDDTETE